MDLHPLEGYTGLMLKGAANLTEGKKKRKNKGD